ncbi:hypothetical protein LG202_09790 [Methylobacillus methanolivorans]
MAFGIALYRYKFSPIIPLMHIAKSLPCAVVGVVLMFCSYSLLVEAGYFLIQFVKEA